MPAQRNAKLKGPQGRPLRVLFIGNIANNAYLNARFLNDAGLDCDVICHDYYHIMGCPEWEDADFEGEVGEHFSPDWSSMNLNGFARPEWFAQGPLKLCVRYLLARRRGDERWVRIWWKALKAYRWLRCRKWARILSLGSWAWELIVWLVFLPTRSARKWARALAGAPREPGARRAPPEGLVARLADAYRRAFPDRPDAVSAEDLVSCSSRLSLWKKLFARYDIVQACSTDPIFPMICGARPYVAFEHGTLRSIPFQDDATGRLTALAYRLADGVVITNCDNIEAARKLELDNYRFIPHPVNPAGVDGTDGVSQLREELAGKLDADFLVFHPARQHWEERRHPDWEKGNDIFLRGLARFVKEVNPKAGAVLVRWGRKVPETEALLAELGIADRVLWVPPQPHLKMVRYVKACDLVADQFFLGAFGSTLPKALACGRACMIYLNEDTHRWCFPELPPVLNARTPDEVFERLRRFSSDADFRRELEETGRDWYRRHHSAEVVVKRHLEMYENIMKGKTAPTEMKV